MTNDDTSKITKKKTLISFPSTFDIFTSIQLPTERQIYIIPQRKNEGLTQIVYEKFRKHNPIILCSTQFACRYKYNKDGFYVILCDMCDLHVFEWYVVWDKFKGRSISYGERVQVDCWNENFVEYLLMKYDNVEMSGCGEEETEKEKIEMSKISGSVEKMKIDPKAVEKEESDLEIDYENILDIFRRNKREIINDTRKKVKNFDRIKFLISRLNRIEKIKDLEIFGIYFTNFELVEFVYRIKDYLISKYKKAYVFYLKDVSYERLTCMDGVECVVIVDCQYFNYFHIDIHLPIVVPFELNLAFSGREWNGEYDINSFEFDDEGINNCRDLITQELYSTGELVKKNECQSVDFFDEGHDVQIYDGLDGIAGSYKQVSKE